MMRGYTEFFLTMIFVLLISNPLAGTTSSHFKSKGTLAQQDGPSDRYLPAFTYDPINERVMMFGGGTNEGEFGDTWVFKYETQSWSELTFETTPTPRHSAVMVYDSSDEVIILFGGWNGTSQATDTWIFDCATETWTDVTTEVFPPGRMSHAMVYDSVNDKVILFSGYGTDGPYDDDTWTFDYSTNTWQEMNPEESPHARYGAGYVFDEVNESMIVFGGNSGGYFSDTWSYDYASNTWTELEPSTHPSALKWSCMTYDSVNHKSILFGGDDVLYQEVNRTWIYDSSINLWEEREPMLAPPEREASGFAFDSVNEKAILFGGTLHYPGTLNDTWAYDYDSNTWEKMGDLPTTSSTTSPTTSPSITDTPDIMIIALAIGGSGILIAILIIVVVARKRK